MEPQLDRSEDGTRRDALRMIGAIGVNCFVPGSVDAQHTHSSTTDATVLPSDPQFFKGKEWAMVRVIADLIIPRTETPGALDVGAPLYIDLMVSRTSAQQELFHSGLEWIASEAESRFDRPFTDLRPEQQLEILMPLSDAIDRGKPSTAAERFFRAFKDLTADGYYTSRVGLTQDLGFKGNTVLMAFPGCAHHEHVG